MLILHLNFLISMILQYHFKVNFNVTSNKLQYHFKQFSLYFELNEVFHRTNIFIPKQKVFFLFYTKKKRVIIIRLPISMLQIRQYFCQISLSLRFSSLHLLTLCKIYNLTILFHFLSIERHKFHIIHCFFCYTDAVIRYSSNIL